MSDSLITKQQLSTFGRNISLLFNRTMMYNAGHPLVIQSIEELHQSALKLLDEISPLVFILNREEFYVDEDPIDPRINVARIVTLFKKAGIQSISFDGDLEVREIKAFMETLSAPAKFPDAEAIKRELHARGVENVKVNHVLYKKVTEDDKVISKEVFRSVTPSGEDKDELKTRKMFMESLLASVVSEEFAKTLNIENIMTNPGDISRKMIEADLEFTANHELGREPGTGGGEGPISAQSSAGGGPGASMGDGSGQIPGAPGGQAPEGAAGGQSPFTGPATGEAGVSDAAAYPVQGGSDAQGQSGDTAPGKAESIPGGRGPADVQKGHVSGGAAGTPQAQQGQATGGPGGGTGGLAPQGTEGEQASGAVQGMSGSPASGGTAGAQGITEGPAPEGTTGTTQSQQGPATGGPGGGTGGLAPQGTEGEQGSGGVQGVSGSPASGGAAGQPGSRVSAKAGGAPGAAMKKGGKKSNGPVILQQLELINLEVEKSLAGDSDVNLSDLASAVFDMKKQLMDGIEAQKALGTAYENEQIIAKKANDLTDKVLVGLVKEEYKAGNISTQRMAQILRRLVPEPDELKRLLPKIKKALMEEGMSAVEYLEMLQELGKELESESLARVLQESSEEIGLDSEGIIDEVKQNPEQAAKLIYLASELRKETGNEEALSDIMATYVEELGAQMANDKPKEDGVDEKTHLAEVMNGIETGILGQLKDLDVGEDVILGLEKRLNDRMEDILDDMREEWLKARKDMGPTEKVKKLTILETLEQSVSEQEELGIILKQVRERTDKDEIDENDFRQIHGEMLKIKREQQLKEAKKKMPPGVLKTKTLSYVLEKEIAKANRYAYIFSVLAFSLVRARPVNQKEKVTIPDEDIIDAALLRIYDTFREVDVVGQLGKNKLVAILPLVETANARRALSRVMKLIHADNYEVNGIQVELKIAGVASTHDGEHPTNLEAFIDRLTDQLTDMATRIRNLNAYI